MGNCGGNNLLNHHSLLIYSVSLMPTLLSIFIYFFFLLHLTWSQCLCLSSFVSPLTFNTGCNWIVHCNCNLMNQRKRTILLPLFLSLSSPSHVSLPIVVFVSYFTFLSLLVGKNFISLHLVLCVIVCLYLFFYFDFFSPTTSVQIDLWAREFTLKSVCRVKVKLTHQIKLTWEGREKMERASRERCRDGEKMKNRSFLVKARCDKFGRKIKLFIPGGKRGWWGGNIKGCIGEGRKEKKRYKYHLLCFVSFAKETQLLFRSAECFTQFDRHGEQRDKKKKTNK